jgi:hypothetical protein
MKTLKSFHSDFPDAQVRFLLTSRPSNDVSDEHKPNILDLDTDTTCRKAIQKDILCVAGRKLDRFSVENGIREPKREELFRILKGHKDETYLFIKLLFEYLNHTSAFNQDWVRIFKDLPATVSEAYNVFLGDVKEGFLELVTPMIKDFACGNPTAFNHGDEYCGGTANQ